MSDLKCNLIYLFHVGTFLGAQAQALPFPHPTKLNTKHNRSVHMFINNLNCKNIFLLILQKLHLLGNAKVFSKMLGTARNNKDI